MCDTLEEWLAVGSAVGVSGSTYAAALPQGGSSRAVIIYGRGRGGHVGDLPGIWERAVPREQSGVEKLDANIRNLNADVQKWAQKGEAQQLTLKLTWDGFAIRWGAWYAARSSVPAFTGDSLRELDQFSSEYNELLRQFKAQGGSTGATGWEIGKSPLSQWLAGLAASGKGGLPWWVGPAITLGLVGAGLYFASPLLIKLLAKRAAAAAVVA